jgi:hypothetical protein
VRRRFFKKLKKPLKSFFSPKYHTSSTKLSSNLTKFFQKKSKKF